MNPGIASYRQAGAPAWGWVKFLGPMESGAILTINSVDFPIDGDTPIEAAKRLVAKINLDRSGHLIEVDTAAPAYDPIKPFWAFYVGPVVYIIATEPGEAGNNITLVYDNGGGSYPNNATVSGATFTGGTAALSDQATLNTGSSGLKTSQTSIAANPDRVWWAIQNHRTTPLYVKLGASASASDFHVVIAGTSATDAGDGGLYADSAYKGEVSVFHAVGYRYSIIEMERAS